MLPRRLLLCAFWLLAEANAARADLILSFTPDGSSTTFTVNQGGTVQVPVYIVERNQAPLTNILSSEGLLSAGVRLNYTPNPGDATVTVAAVNPGFNTNTAGFPVIDNSQGFASVSAGTTNLSGVQASGSPPSILVGTFTFMGGNVGNVSVQTAKPQTASFPEFVSNSSFTVLETQPYANIFYAQGVPANLVSYFTTITVVPEPGSFVLIGLPVAAMWLRRRVLSVV